MLFDALVLEGGRSSRLGEVPKSALVFHGHTLLARTVAAARAARTIAVVGPNPPAPLPPRVILAREEPPFAGPAAAVAAGLAALACHAGAPAPYTLVLACDMPGAPEVVLHLLGALRPGDPASDGLIAIDADGMRQPLAAIYATTALTASASAHAADHSLEGLSMRRLITALTLTPVRVSRGETDDVDTWDDARRLGVTMQTVDPRENQQDETSRTE